MKVNKKWIMLMLVMLLVLSACGTNNGDSNDGNTSNMNNTNQQPSETNNQDSDNVTANNQKDEEPEREHLELNWFVVASNNSSLPPEEEDFVKQAIEEKFNVDFTIEHMGFSKDRTQQLNLRLAGGSAPDMMIANAVDVNKYIQDEIIIDLKKWVNPEMMPNYFNWVSEDELKAYQVLDVFKRAPYPYAKTQYISYYIRQDWLDHLKLEVPTNYEEMIEVMRAFTFDDPDDNGQDDTYGYTTNGGGTVKFDFPEFYEAGFPSGLYVEGNKFIDRGTDPRIAGTLDNLRETLDKGIVDPDWFLQKGSAHYDKASQGKVGIFYSINKEIAFDNAPISVQRKTKEITGDPDVNWQPFHPWSDTGVSTERLPGHPFVFSVETPEEKIERSVEILNWLAGEEGFLLTHYGVEGEHYTRDGNTITINPDAYKADIIDQGNFLDIYDFFTPDEPQVLGLEKVSPLETDRDRAIVEKLMTYKYVPSIGTTVSIPTGANLGALRGEMRKYHAQVLLDEPDSSKWPEYRRILMTDYGGKEIFEAYAEQVGKALGKDLTFDSGLE